MASPGGYAWLAEDEGFILYRAIAGEAEILTLAVAPDARRRGVARALVETAMAAAAAAGTTSAFLEVAESNAAAIALYQSAGFAEVGRRPGYLRPHGPRRRGRAGPAARPRFPPDAGPMRMLRAS